MMDKNQAILDEIMEKAILPLPIINHQQVVDIIAKILTAQEGCYDGYCSRCGYDERDNPAPPKGGD